VVEYALVLVHSSMAGLGLLTQQVNAWIGDINWTLVGYAALCLVASVLRCGPSRSRNRPELCSPLRGDLPYSRPSPAFAS
jgi:hypothetical protein